MILLLGGSGYIGQAFQNYLGRTGKPYKSIARSECDYTNRDQLLSLVRKLKPSFVINAAGFTGKPNVDACEIRRSACLAGNAVLPGTIREVCETTSTPWGHVSSGCIYTGKRDDGNGFTEEDEPNFSFRTNNSSFYSGTKGLGEEVLAGVENCYIWRLRIPFDHRDSPRNYLTKLIDYDTLLSAENSISKLDDFVRCCIDCYARAVPYGIYNVTNTGFVTTAEVVELIQKHLLPQREFKFFADENEFMALAAKTPRSNCVLDNSKLRETGITIPEVHDAVIKALKSWEWSGKARPVAKGISRRGATARSHA